MASETGKPTVVVTGGTKGLGKAICLAFGRAGFEVIAIFQSDVESARVLEQEFSSSGITGRTVKVDLTSPDSESELLAVAQTVAAGELVVIHNACARFQPTLVRQLEWPDFEQSFTVAVRGALSCAKVFLPLMAKCRNGTFVTVLSSATHELPPKGFGAYHTAKHALLGLTQSLAVESAIKGIRVFSVSPKFMDTPLTQSWDARLVESMTQNPEQVDDPEQVARFIFRLVKDPTLPGRGEDYRP